MIKLVIFTQLAFIILCASTLADSHITKYVVENNNIDRENDVISSSSFEAEEEYQYEDQQARGGHIGKGKSTAEEEKNEPLDLETILSKESNSKEINAATFERKFANNVDEINDIFENNQQQQSPQQSPNSLLKSSIKITELSKAKIIALNKITAKSSEIILNLDEAKYFGNMEITMHKCFKALNPYRPENSVLLTLTDNKIDEDPLLIFKGWMFSSSFSLSTFEHPVYEIFVKECL